MPLRSTEAAHLWALAENLHDLSRTILRVLHTNAGLEPLPASEFSVIMKIQSDPGITVTALAIQLGMQQSNTSSAVRELTKRGLVRREKSSSDGRTTLLYPTDMALANRDIIEQSWSTTLDAAMLRLSPEHQQAVLGATEALGALDEQLRTL